MYFRVRYIRLKSIFIQNKVIDMTLGKFLSLLQHKYKKKGKT